MMRDILHPIQSKDIILKIDVEGYEWKAEGNKSYVMSLCLYFSYRTFCRTRLYSVRLQLPNNVQVNCGKWLQNSCEITVSQSGRDIGLAHQYSGVSVCSVDYVVSGAEGKSLIALYLKPRWEVVTPFPVWKTPLHHLELCNLSDIYHISVISFTWCSH